MRFFLPPLIDYVLCRMIFVSLNGCIWCSLENCCIKLQLQINCSCKLIVVSNLRIRYEGKMCDTFLYPRKNNILAIEDAFKMIYWCTSFTGAIGWVKLWEVCKYLTFKNHCFIRYSQQFGLFPMYYPPTL